LTPKAVTKTIMNSTIDRHSCPYFIDDSQLKVYHPDLVQDSNSRKENLPLIRRIKKNELSLDLIKRILKFDLNFNYTIDLRRN
jgi:hypothetical protein